MTDASAPQRLAPTTDGGPVGPVMVIGGAEDKLGERVILSRFVQLAGGDQARIAVISTASALGDARRSCTARSSPALASAKSPDYARRLAKRQTIRGRSTRSRT